MEAIEKVEIFYFSGTGNSKQVAMWFSEYASEKNIDCSLHDISKLRKEEIKNIVGSSLIIIISPIHGFNYPRIVLEFIKNFPPGKNNIALMNTRAGMKLGPIITPGLTGIAFVVASLMLKMKGYKITGQIPFDMPSNWLSIHPALNKNAVKYLHEKNYLKARRHAAKIFSGKKDFLALRDIIQDLIISPVSFLYYFIGRYALAKSFYASYKCDNCTLCVKKCPVKAIEIFNDHPYWTFKCESCMKCMNFCPKRAIETSHGLFLAIYFIISFFSSLSLPAFMQNGLPGQIFSFVLVNLLFLILLWGLYRVQHLFLKHKVIGRIISLTSLTSLKFWGRYRSLLLHKLKKDKINIFNDV